MVAKKNKPDLVEAANKKRHILLLQKLKEGSLTPKEIAELERFEKGELPSDYDWRALNQNQVLNILNVTAHTINKWVANGCPMTEKGGKKIYDCGKILKWRIEYQKELDGVDGDLGGGASSDALEDYRKVKAEMARFELDIKKEKFVPIDEVEERSRSAGDYVRKSLQSMARKISLDVSKDPSTLEKRINEEVELILRKMSEC